MTPKEKANQLVLFYSELVDFTDNNFNTCHKSKMKRAKKCAVRCVEELIDLANLMDGGFSFEKELEYLREVEKEIDAIC